MASELGLASEPWDPWDQDQNAHPRDAFGVRSKFSSRRDEECLALLPLAILLCKAIAVGSCPGH